MSVNVTCPKCQRNITLSLDDLRSITVLECAKCGERIALRDPPPAPRTEPEPPPVPSVAYQPDGGAPRWYHNPLLVGLVLLVALLLSETVSYLARRAYEDAETGHKVNELKRLFQSMQR
jgi:hypothetical protein